MYSTLGVLGGDAEGGHASAEHCHQRELWRQRQRASNGCDLLEESWHRRAFVRPSYMLVGSISEEKHEVSQTIPDKY